jgi:hypothetical protein
LRRLARVAGAFALLTIVAWLAVPPLVRSQLESRLTDALDRRTTIESVAFNPFLLRLTVRQLAVADRSGAVPLLAVDEVVADLAGERLFLIAPRVGDDAGGKQAPAALTRVDLALR